MPEPFEERTELVAAYLDGTATEEQREQIEGRLAGDPDLADRLALQARLAIMLESMGRLESHRVEFATRRQRRRAVLRLWTGSGIAAALLIAALVGYALWRRSPGPTDLRIVSSGAGVILERGGEKLAALTGLVLFAGDVVRTATGQSCILGDAGEGTRIEMSEDAEVHVPVEGTGRRIGVRRGGISATVASQPAGTAFLVVTPHARIEVVGTRFLVRVGAASTRLEVREGRVLIGKPGEGKSVPVGAGQYALAEKGKTIEALPLPAAEVHGLKGEYFDNEDFTNPVMERIDDRVDFTWGLGAPHPSMDPDYFSVRWTGEVEPAFSETYDFHVVSDDGARLWVDGKLLIDDWKVRGTQERSGSIALAAGEKVQIRLEYFDCVSMAQVHLSWSSPRRRKELIPPDRLTPAK